jgi:two-component system phosphate regulon sensor histidine kinase PhoR
MAKRPLVARLLPSYAAVALVAVIVIGWFSTAWFEQASLRTARRELVEMAEFLDQQLGPEIDSEPRDFSRLAQRLQQTRGLRISRVSPAGKVELDTLNRPDEIEAQLTRPEIQQALAGTTSIEIRSNPAQDERVCYLAAPVSRNDARAGVLYLSRSLAPVDDAVTRLRIWLVLISTVLIALTVPLAWWSARQVAEPVVLVRRAADSLVAGKWQTRVSVPEEQEFAALAESFNRMAADLQQRFGVLIQNNNEQQAVLASMAEGVVAVDSQERVISMNPACGRLLGLDPAQVAGRRLQESLRNADLSRFVSRALSAEDPVEADVLLHGDRERVMQAHGSALHDLEGKAIGAVVVLNDVTDFRRLEHIRRDFVANVSHELKTPITSIKGFVETLLDGAMKDPLDCERFLRIVAKQADRLHAIIEDLLSLSKIEQSEDADTIVLEPAPLRNVLESAANNCHSAALERQIHVALDCEASLRACINPMLFEQAVVNLLDNAIKYSDPGREVQLSAGATDEGIVISVADRGSGIAGEHLTRIFERFYRVDRARSRKLGGTGLGLAIVKHIVQAHHGRISVESTLGTGSTFTIHLPSSAAVLALRSVAV